MPEVTPTKTSRLKRVRKNLGYALTLAWAASPRLLIRHSLLEVFNAIMPPGQSVNQLLHSILMRKGPSLKN